MKQDDKMTLRQKVMLAIVLAIATLILIVIGSIHRAQEMQDYRRKMKEHIEQAPQHKPMREHL